MFEFSYKALIKNGTVVAKRGVKRKFSDLESLFLSFYTTKDILPFIQVVILIPVFCRGTEELYL